jgi:iron-sulfur cluster assembly protein
MSDIKITDKAISKIIETIQEDGKSLNDHHLRVGVMSGGCSGLQYFMDFGSNADIDDSDEIIELNELQVVVDKKSFFYLLGSQLDFSTGLNGKGFEWSNPQAARSCGCGESFSL